MKKVALITGFYGQDGFYLTEYLINNGYKVIGAVRKINEHDFSHKNNKDIDVIDWPYKDQKKIDEIIRNFNPHEIYNLAAYTSGQKMDFNPVENAELNAMSVVRILDAVSRINKKIKILQASSREIFGEPNSSPQNEKTLKQPRNSYGASKLFADNMIRVYRKNMDLFSCSAILYNHESPRRRAEFVTQKIIKSAVKIKRGIIKKLEIGNLGSIRDWGSAKEFVIAMHLMLQAKKPEDFIIASGQSFTVRNICEIVFDHLKLNYENYVISDNKNYRDIESESLIGDISKIKKELSWSPSISFENILIEMVNEELNRG